MEGDRLDALGLPLMVPSAENEEAMATAFTVTVDALQGISTGISAEVRAPLVFAGISFFDACMPTYPCCLVMAKESSFLGDQIQPSTCGPESGGEHSGGAAMGRVALCFVCL